MASIKMFYNRRLGIPGRQSTHDSLDTGLSNGKTPEGSVGTVSTVMTVHHGVYPPAEAAEGFKQGSWGCGLWVLKGEQGGGGAGQPRAGGQQEPWQRLPGSQQEPSMEQQPARRQGAGPLGVGPGRQARRLGVEKRGLEDRPGVQEGTVRRRSHGGGGQALTDA